MKATSVCVAALAATGALAAPVAKRAFTYGSTPVRGVNIGGWLLLEPWITPSIFQRYNGSVIDEYTLTNLAPDAESVLRSHWDSWVTLKDFQKLADSGINLVRIPIGYWAFQKFPGDPYIPGANQYLEKALGWAREANLTVWIDLHGAPLSQNGFDNSGQRTTFPQWTSSSKSIDATVDVIGKISEQYGGSDYADVVAGIQLMNEPNVWTIPGGREGLEAYYKGGFEKVRDAGHVSAIISDGFDAPNSWNEFLTGEGAMGAIVDHHEYQVFNNEQLAWSAQEHIDYVYSNSEEWASGVDKYLICGEWTAAMTDCAPALNGYAIGARYDGTFSRQAMDGTFETSDYIGSCEGINDISQWSDEQKTNTKNYIAAQLDVFENRMQGWIFWNFKTESAAEWDYLRLVEAKVWPDS